jgi:hypothetical protein
LHFVKAHNYKRVENTTRAGGGQAARGGYQELAFR